MREDGDWFGEMRGGDDGGEVVEREGLGLNYHLRRGCGRNLGRKLGI